MIGSGVLPSGWVKLSELGAAGVGSVDSGWLCATVKQLATLPPAVDAKLKALGAKRTKAHALPGYFTLVIGANDNGASYVAGEVRRGALSLTAPLSHFFLLSEWVGSLQGSLVSLRYLDGSLYVDGSGSELVLDGWTLAEDRGEVAADVSVKLSARVVAAVDAVGAVVKVAVKSSVILTGPYDVAKVAARIGEGFKHAGVATVHKGGVVMGLLDDSPFTVAQWGRLVKDMADWNKMHCFSECLAVLDSSEVADMSEMNTVVEVAAVIPAVEVVEVVMPGEVVEAERVEAISAHWAARDAARLAAVAELVEVEARATVAPAVVVVAQSAPAPVVLPVLGHGERVTAYLDRLICPHKAAFARSVLVELAGGAAASVPIGMAVDLAADVRRRVGSLVKKDGRAVQACAAD